MSQQAQIFKMLKIKVKIKNKVVSMLGSTTFCVARSSPATLSPAKDSAQGHILSSFYTMFTLNWQSVKLFPGQ